MTDEPHDENGAFALSPAGYQFRLTRPAARADW